VFWNRRTGSPPTSISASIGIRTRQGVGRDAAARLSGSISRPRAVRPRLHAGGAGRPRCRQALSKNSPFQFTLDLRLNKEFRLGGGRRMNLTLNATTSSTPRFPRIDPLTGRGYEAARACSRPRSCQAVLGLGAALPPDRHLGDPSNYSRARRGVSGST